MYFQVLPAFFSGKMTPTPEGALCGFAGGFLCSAARQYFPGLEVFREDAPLNRLFFRKPLLIEDYF